MTSLSGAGSSQPSDAGAVPRVTYKLIVFSEWRLLTGDTDYELSFERYALFEERTRLPFPFHLCTTLYVSQIPKIESSSAIIAAAVAVVATVNTFRLSPAGCNHVHSNGYQTQTRSPWYWEYLFKSWEYRTRLHFFDYKNITRKNKRKYQCENASVFFSLWHYRKRIMESAGLKKYILKLFYLSANLTVKLGIRASMFQFDGSTRNIWF